MCIYSFCADCEVVKEDKSVEACRVCPNIQALKSAVEENQDKELEHRKQWQYRYFPNLKQYVVFCPYCDVIVNVMIDQVLEFQYCPYCGKEVDTSKGNG